MDDLEKQVTQIKNTIAALEAQRGVLDDSVITASIAALQEKLSSLEARPEPPEQQRKQEPARELVSAIYAGFTEGFDTPDLHQAAEFIK